MAREHVAACYNGRPHLHVALLAVHPPLQLQEGLPVLQPALARRRLEHAAQLVRIRELQLQHAPLVPQVPVLVAV